VASSLSPPATSDQERRCHPGDHAAGMAANLVESLDALLNGQARKDADHLNSHWES
jgi:hypothetical protein